MIYRLSHTTTYEYGGMVSLSHHLLRLRPRDLSLQRCLEYELHVEPRPDVLCERVDYFGNSLTFLTIEGSHKRLVLAAHSKVEVMRPQLPKPTDCPSWEVMEGLSLQSQEFVYSSPLIKKLPEFGDYATASFLKGRPLLEAVLDLTKRLHADFKFDPKATNVATPLLEVFNDRRGVCQDFAHLQIAFLRCMGVPARYVSGYLETDPPPGQPRMTGADASHAWVSFYCPALGWVDVDPTNNLLVSDRHITVAWGRDYGDISPVRGIIVGTGEHVMDVAVDVVPLAQSNSFDNNFLASREQDSPLPRT